MKLLPNQQTEAQLAALRGFINAGELHLDEPCDCNGQIRHNNGGNYHERIQVKADGGRYFVLLSSTSDYDNAEWEESSFLDALNLIQDRAAKGYRYRVPTQPRLRY